MKALEIISEEEEEVESKVILYNYNTDDNDDMSLTWRSAAGTVSFAWTVDGLMIIRTSVVAESNTRCCFTSCVIAWRLYVCNVVLNEDT